MKTTTILSALLFMLLWSGCASSDKKEPAPSPVLPPPVVTNTTNNDPATLPDTSLLTGLWIPVTADLPKPGSEGNIFRYDKGVHTLYHKSQNQFQVVYSGQYRFEQSGKQLLKTYVLGGAEINTTAEILKLTHDTLILKGTGTDALPGEKVFIRLKTDPASPTKSPANQAKPSQSKNR